MCFIIPLHFTLYTAISVNFSSATYTVHKANRRANICLELSGQTKRNVSITLTSQPEPPSITVIVLTLTPADFEATTYCHNLSVSEELFSYAQAEGFTVRLQTYEGERGVTFGLSSASVKVVDGECVYFCSGPLMHIDNGIPLQCLLCRNLQWSRYHTQWHSKHVVFTMQKHYAWFTKILT